MPKWVVALVGAITGLLLSAVVLGASTKLVSAIRASCGVDTNPADGLGILVAAPAIFFGSLIVTVVVFALVVTFVRQDWSIAAAIIATVLAATILTVVSTGYLYDAAPTNQCPSGAPSWWPFPA